MIWVVIMFVIWNFAMHLHKEGQIRDLMTRVAELEELR